jgi:hypothetical protein
MNLKKYKEELLFICMILFFIAIWRILLLFKDMYSSQISAKNTITEGMTDKQRKETEDIIGQTDQILAEANKLIQENQKKTLLNSGKSSPNNQGNKDGFVSINQLSLNTPNHFWSSMNENHMTIHNRQLAATLYDHATPAATNVNPDSNILQQPESIFNLWNTNGKEGLENKNNKVRITSLTNTSDNSFKLRDYYIKSSYNSFNDDNFDYSTISMDACLYVLSRGCRFIDFEVFSIDNVPVIASSSDNNYTTKKSKNSIPVSDAFEVLGNYAFSSAKCPNSEDPFFIHMRIMSENITMYNKLEEVIKNSKSIARRLLPPKYGMDYGVDGASKDLGNEPLLDFKGKIVIIVDSSNPVYKKTNFYKYVNMSSNTLFLSKKTFFDVKNIADPNQYKESNKKNMALVLPVKAAKPKNEGHNAPYIWGSQIVAMCFQEPARDNNLIAYESAFDAVGFAFILKPKDLRYIPITIAPPKPPNPNSSFEGKPAEAVGIGALPPF